MQENKQTFYHILPNGLKIVHRLTDSPVAFVGVMVGAGTRDEQPEENGMAHYIEHCVFKGTTHHSARAIIHAIEGIGGEINAYTTKEETTFYAATLCEHVQRTLHLIAEMLLEPTFKKEETDKERMVILDEIESYNDQPSELIYDDFENLVFSGSSLALPILGTKKTLRHISSKPEFARNWMRTHYTPDRMVVFCQGNLRPDRIFRLAEREFGSLQVPSVSPLAFPSPSPSPSPSPLPSPKVALEFTSNRRSTDGQPTVNPDVSTISERERTFRRRTHQTHVMIGQRAYPLGHERQLPLYLLNNILGGGSLNSRLNLSMRETHGLVYQVESTYTPLSDTGYWATYFACEPEHAEQCMTVFRHELERLQDHPLSETNLRNALRQLRGQMAIAAQNQENSALAMAKSMLYFSGAPTWQETYQKIAQTTSDQLLQISREILSVDNLLTLRYE